MAKLLTNLQDFPDASRGGAVAVGNFDGVHRGHAMLVCELVQQAQRVGGPAIVMTFDPPPVAVLVPDRPPTLPLTSIRRRAELLGKLGVDILIAYPTDRALVDLSPTEFFEQKIVGAVGAGAMVEGPNFRFGKDRAGDTQLLQGLCDERAIGLTIVAPRCDEAGQMISSTRIRSLLSEGELRVANEMFTEPYLIEGIVVKGSQRGRQLGFPTANLQGLANLVPAHGVYAGTVSVNGQAHTAAVHIGPNPTFGEKQAKVEIHILDWTGEIYGERLMCTLLEQVRGVQKFDSAEALRLQLQSDIARCRKIAKPYLGV